MVVEMYRVVKNWSVQVESYDCGCKRPRSSAMCARLVKFGLARGTLQIRAISPLAQSETCVGSGPGLLGRFGWWRTARQQEVD